MQSKNGKIRILVADMQYLIRIALEKILNERYYITGIVSSKPELLNTLKSEETDLLIIDYNLFGIDCIQELSELKNKYSCIHILIFINEVNYNEIKNLADIGIKNILLKTADEDELNTAIDYTYKGKNYYSQDFLNLLIVKNHDKQPLVEDAHLTSTEIEIVKLISKGMTAKEIASYKNISFHTVMTHRKNIFRKVQVKNVSELIIYAIKKGWIDNIEYYI